jgi:DNA adenine methylase
MGRTKVDGPARPFLKWAGGKTQLLSRILERLPVEIDTYYEPFVGGGAVFFALAAEGRFRRARLTDRNRDLIDVYRALRDDVDKVIRELRGHAENHSEEHYYDVRAQSPRTLARRAARIIYLNKTGYNGLYRVNSSGRFNVPFGRYKNPGILDEANLRAAARTLENVTLETGDFAKVCDKAGPKDAVYMDPPYLPVSKTASFTAYDREQFGLEEHRRLALVFGQLARRGVPAVLSNSDTPETRALYGSFNVETVMAARAINSAASKRGRITEILVSSAACSRRPGAPRANAAAG